MDGFLEWEDVALGQNLPPCFLRGKAGWPRFSCTCTHKPEGAFQHRKAENCHFLASSVTLMHHFWSLHNSCNPNPSSFAAPYVSHHWKIHAAVACVSILQHQHPRGPFPAIITDLIKEQLLPHIHHLLPTVVHNSNLQMHTGFAMCQWPFWEIDPATPSNPSQNDTIQEIGQRSVTMKTNHGTNSMDRLLSGLSIPCTTDC